MLNPLNGSGQGSQNISTGNPEKPKQPIDQKSENVAQKALHPENLPNDLSVLKGSGAFYTEEEVEQLLNKSGETVAKGVDKTVVAEDQNTQVQAQLTKIKEKLFEKVNTSRLELSQKVTKEAENIGENNAREAQRYVGAFTRMMKIADDEPNIEKSIQMFQELDVVAELINKQIDGLIASKKPPSPFQKKGD
jgi:hypothetical protein